MREVKKMLRNYKRNQDKLQNLIIKLEMLEEDRAGRGVGLGEIKSNRDRVSDPTGDIASGIVDKSVEINGDIKEIRYELQEVEELLKGLTAPQRTIIVARYVYHQEWREVARVSRLSISDAQLKSLEALKILEMIVEGVR